MAKSLEAQLREIAERRTGDIEDIASASMLRMGNRIIQGSPVDDGRFINNWMSAFNGIDYSTSRPENKAGTDSTAGLESKTSKVELNVDFYFTNSLPYAKRLEYEGWSAQASKGMVRINALHWDKIVQQEVNKRK